MLPTKDLLYLYTINYSVCQLGAQGASLAPGVTSPLHHDTPAPDTAPTQAQYPPTFTQPQVQVHNHSADGGHWLETLHDSFMLCCKAMPSSISDILKKMRPEF